MGRKRSLEGKLEFRAGWELSYLAHPRPYRPPTSAEYSHVVLIIVSRSLT